MLFFFIENMFCVSVNTSCGHVVYLFGKYEQHVSRKKEPRRLNLQFENQCLYSNGSRVRPKNWTLSVKDAYWMGPHRFHISGSSTAMSLLKFQLYHVYFQCRHLWTNNIKNLRAFSWYALRKSYFCLQMYHFTSIVTSIPSPRKSLDSQHFKDLAFKNYFLSCK